jgi:hypothetical protein
MDADPRIDAYPGIRLDRDMGAGQNAEDWISEVGASNAGRATSRSYLQTTRRTPGASPGPVSIRSGPRTPPAGLAAPSVALWRPWADRDVRLLNPVLLLWRHTQQSGRL